LLPDVWEAALLTLAAYRWFRLSAEDDLLNRPRAWLLKRIRSDKLELFIQCPACAGFWIVLCWYAAWQIEQRWTLLVAVPFAANAVMIFLRRNLDPPAE
jgi:hypothetical protein